MGKLKFLRYLSQALRRLQQLRHFSVMYLSMKESSIRFYDPLGNLIEVRTLVNYN